MNVPLQPPDERHPTSIKAASEFPGSPLSQAFQQPLMLGVFLNLQDIRHSSYPTSNSWTYDYNVEIVKRAEALGFELAFSRTQWLPKGGYDGEASLDSFIALAAMAGVTSRILLISTIHVLYGPWHPLHLAKFGATLDHISKGRWGINIVTGHRAVEHEMFGWQRIEHDQRYVLAAELFDVVERLWSEDDNFSFQGISSWKVNNAFITPKPLFGRPVIVNATGSKAGINFAARYSDIIFTTSPGGTHIESVLETLPEHIKYIRQAAKTAGRGIRTLISPIIISRDTERETQDYVNAIGFHALPPKQKGFHRYDSDAHAWRARQDKSHKQGLNLGGNIQIIGTPEQVVEQLAALKKIGIDGVQLSFYDFAKDIDYFGDKILPLLKQADLRV
jgi:FMNH2-dependent dimethyl sulfone monooxygenase